MNILFLDIDGVLNSVDFYYRIETYKAITSHRWDEDGGHHFVDPEAVNRVVTICRNLDVKLVISSSWRMRTVEETIDDFANYRDLKPLLPYIVGVTRRSKSGHRGTEIANWLSEHDDVSNYVIVDDDSDMTDEQKNGHFVRTHESSGLDFFKMSDIVKLFNKQKCNTTTSSEPSPTVFF